MPQGRAAASGDAGSGRRRHRAGGILLPDARTRLAGPPGQARRLADPGAHARRGRPERSRRRADHSGQRVLGTIAGQRIEPLEATVRRQLGGHRAPAQAGAHPDPRTQDPRAVLRADPPARAGGTGQGPRTHAAHGQPYPPGALPQPEDRGNRSRPVAPPQPGQGPAARAAGTPGDQRGMRERTDIPGEGRRHRAALRQ